MITGKNFLIFLLAAFAQTRVEAQLWVPTFVSDNMVLQQNDTFHLEGKAVPGGKVTASADWGGTKITTTANNNGNWKLNLPTSKAGGPYTLTISSGSETLVRTNILLGEVWICSGQSNMQWSVENGINNGKAEAAEANWPAIRMLYIPQTESDTLRTDADAQWQVCTPAVMRKFSAAGYFFGRKLHKELNVPIGLINCNWGGTNIEAWMSPKPKNLPTDSVAWNAFKSEKIKLAKPSSTLYNAMLYPLHIFSVAGSLWYQGESNVLNSRFYKTYLKWMVQDWRKLFGNNMSFYYAQIAPFRYKKSFSGALLQEQQRLAMGELQNAGMIVTADIAGDVSDIHPKNKLDVGERMARWALNKNYKKNNLVVSGPMYSGMRPEKGQIRIKFKHAESGLLVRGDTVANLQIAGENKEFRTAYAKIDGSDLLVFNPNIKKPLAVRMAFQDWAEANLFNKEGLPASPFRTDNFPVEAEVDYAVSINGNGSKTIRMLSKDKIFYTLDGSIPNQKSSLYTSPIQLSASATLRARTLRTGMLSSEILQKRVFISNSYIFNKIELQTMPDKKYAAKGAATLNDGEAGDNIFSDGTWLGFYDADAIINIDLGAEKLLNTVTLGLLQAQTEWIFFPQQIRVLVSNDGVTYKEEKFAENAWVKSESAEFAEEKLTMPNNVKGRYLKIHLKNVTKIPDWHLSKGNPAWIFIDEISVE